MTKAAADLLNFLILTPQLISCEKLLANEDGNGYAKDVGAKDLNDKSNQGNLSAPEATPQV